MISSAGHAARTNASRAPRHLRVGTALAASLLLAGCVLERPTGDFGRPEKSIVHDVFAPAAGKQLARARGEPVSGFNLTNDEEELRERAWTFVRPPHARDWLGAVVAEGERTRVLPDLDTNLSKERYYRFLRSDRYHSSDARYERVIEDLNADIALLKPYCALAYKIQAIDQERLRAVDARVSVDPKFVKNAYNRVAENQRVMTWVWRSVKYRARSYDYAIDSLELETPSGKLFNARLAFRRFKGAITVCEAGPAGGDKFADGLEVRRSRVVTNFQRPETVPQK